MERLTLRCSQVKDYRQTQVLTIMTPAGDIFIRSLSIYSETPSFYCNIGVVVTCVVHEVNLEEEIFEQIVYYGG